MISRGKIELFMNGGTGRAELIYRMSFPQVVNGKRKMIRWIRFC